MLSLRIRNRRFFGFDPYCLLKRKVLNNTVFFLHKRYDILRTSLFKKKNFNLKCFYSKRQDFDVAISLKKGSLRLDILISTETGTLIYFQSFLKIPEALNFIEGFKKDYMYDLIYIVSQKRIPYTQLP